MGRWALGVGLLVGLAMGGAAGLSLAPAPHSFGATPAATQLAVRVGEHVDFAVAPEGAVRFTWLLGDVEVAHERTWTFEPTSAEAGRRVVRVAVAGEDGIPHTWTWELAVAPLAAPELVELDPPPGVLTVNANDPATFHCRARVTPEATDRLRFDWLVNGRVAFTEERSPGAGASEFPLATAEPGDHRVAVRVTRNDRSITSAEWQVAVAAPVPAPAAPAPDAVATRDVAPARVVPDERPAPVALAAARPAAPPPASHGRSMLEHLTVENDAAPAVRIRLSGPATPRVGTLAARDGMPFRIYVDLPGTALAPTAVASVSGKGPLLRVRTGRFDDSTTRVVLDLGSPEQYTVSHDADTITIALTPRADRVAAARPTRPPPVASPAPPPEPPAAVAAVPPPGPPVIAATPPAGPAAVAAAPPTGPAAVAAAPPPAVAAALPAEPAADEPAPRLALAGPAPIAAASAPPPGPPAPDPPAARGESRAPTPPAHPDPVAEETPARLAFAGPPPAAAPAAPPAPPAAETPARAARRPLPRPLPAAGPTVVIVDAGHGGRDPGAAGIGGVLEKDVVLEVAQRLATVLMSRLQVDVVMTRADDTFVPIDRRLALGGDSASLFISLHANACADRTARGVEVFYGGGRVRTASTAGADPRAALLGRSLYRALEAEFGAVRHGAQPAGFGVLVRNHVPSALVEIGYLTHPEEAAQAQQAGYQERLANALTDGVEAFLRASAPPL